MIKKISLYTSLAIMISLLMLTLTYFYNVYLIKTPIKINYLNESVTKELKTIFKKKINDNDIELEFKKSTLEINKFPSLFRLNISKIDITNKKNSLKSSIESIVLDLSFFDLVNNFIQKKANLDFSNLIIDRIIFSGELNKKGFQSDPFFKFIYFYFTENKKGLSFNKNLGKFEVSNIDILLNDKTNYFKNNLIKISCNKFFFSNEKLNINCKNKNFLDFNLAFYKINDFNYINGKINKFDLDFINTKKINLNTNIRGNIVSEFKIILKEDFKFKNIKLNFLKSSIVDFPDGFQKVGLLSKNKFNFVGGIDWYFDELNLEKETININDLIINKNTKINGKIKREKYNFKSNLKIKSNQINGISLKKFNLEHLDKNSLVSKQIRFLKDLFNNSKKQKLTNIETSLSFSYDNKTNNFLLEKLNAFGYLDIKDLSLSSEFFKKGILDFNGTFNFDFLDKELNMANSNYQLNLKGNLKNIKLITKYNEKQFFFKKGNISGKINSNQMIIDKLSFYQNNYENLSMIASFLKNNEKYEISKLNINVSNLDSNLTSMVVSKLKEYAKFSSNWKINSGKISDGNIYVKLKDSSGKKLHKKIILCKLYFDNLNLSSNNRPEILFQKLKLIYDSQNQASGESYGLIQNIPFKVNFNINEKLDLKAFGSIEINKDFEKKIRKNFHFQIESPLKIDFNISGNLNTESHKVNLSGDLSSSLININLLNFFKQKNEEGFFRTTIFFNNYKFSKIKNLELSNKKEKILSTLISQDDNKITINNLLSKNLDIDKIVLITFPNKHHISIRGDAVDLSFLRKNLENKNLQINKKFEFDIISTNIYLGQNLSLSGNYKGIIENNNIESKAWGKMSFANNPLLDEGELKISIINDDAILKGKGLVGGAETYVRIKSLKNKIPRIFFQTQDGGKLLERLNFTNKVRSGEMTLEIKFLDKSFNSYDGIIRGINFNVVEVPGVVKALSSLGFSGVNSLFIGQGVGFDEGIAKFTKNKNIMFFEKILINNDRLSIFLNGDYNSANEDIAFVGSIAPIKLISKIISVVPAVGELLTGLNKEGVFAGQFKLTGTIDDPEIDLNELSFAPGILRDIFSRDWIKENKSRIKK